MTPHRSNQRGTFRHDRVFNGIGRICVASGTNDKATFRACDAMLTALFQQGHPHLLTLIRDGQLKSVFVYGYYRQHQLDKIPFGPLAKDLQTDWTAWMQSFPPGEISASHRKDLRLTGKALGEGLIGDVPDLLEALIAKKAGKPTAQRQHRVHVQAYLAARVGKDSPLYLRVKAIRSGKVVVQDKATPRSVGEIRSLMGKMSEGQAEVWSLCGTGMGPKEYWGAWEVLPDRVAIHGTKRGSRERVVPRWTVITKPTMGSRKLARLVSEASEGMVRLYDFRATFLRWLAEAGVDEVSQQFYAGHKARTMTMQYQFGELPGQLLAHAALLERYVGGPGLQLIRGA